jgi:hypothetical protein
MGNFVSDLISLHIIGLFLLEPVPENKEVPEKWSSTRFFVDSYLQCRKNYRLRQKQVTEGRDWFNKVGKEVRPTQRQSVDVSRENSLWLLNQRHLY